MSDENPVAELLEALPDPGGRPTKYKAEFCEQAYKLYLLKATDEEVADFIGVHVDTLHEWRKVHSKFSEATTRGKTQADAEVAEKLRERAMGYSHKAVKIFMPAGATEPVYAEYIEHYPPDTQAASLWLRNRQPEKWRDKQDHEVAGPGGGPIDVKAKVDVTGLTNEQLRALASIPVQSS